MAPNDKRSASGNLPLLGYHSNEVQNTVHVNAQHQTLLNALQDLIVRVMDTKQQSRCADMNKVHLGPEAGKLINALQEFISSVLVCCQSGAQNTIHVSLEEDHKLQAVNSNGNGQGEAPSIGASSSKLFSTDVDGDEIMDKIPSGLDIKPKKPKPALQEKLLRALQEHIFNTLPIRLLCFEPHGDSSFRIALLERGAIYARLASTLQRKMHEEEFRPQEMAWSDDIVVMETEREIIKRLISKYARYAILSHTWLRTAPGEVTYSDWNNGRFDARDSGYRKLVNFCKASWKDYGLSFAWMDTVCINKDSSSELDESIRSMYNWYKRATVCVIYLAETETLADMHVDPWFTRGWTLQELLAPDVIKFYNGRWKQLVDDSRNDKNDTEITKQITRATTLSRRELDYIRDAPISRKMQLAANREVTREEDVAYSLMGIFDVSFSTAYGEGAPRAFFRLLQEILASSEHVLEVLNWAGELPASLPYHSSVLPSSPKYYINRSSNRGLILRRPIEPLTVTHLGLRVPVVLMPGISIRDATSRHNPIGDYNATVHISPIEYYNYLPTTYHLLDNRISGGDGRKKDNDWYQITFAVFNFTQAANIIYLPKTSIAKGLRCYEAVGEVSTAGVINSIPTHRPIVFELDKRTTVDERSSGDFWHVEAHELARHGMRLMNLYL